MSRFREELALIPPFMWVLTIVGYVATAMLFVTVVAREMPPGVRYFFGLCIPLIFSSVFLLSGYIYGDAKRRNMRPLMWALLALLIPNAIGIILYFILREPVMQICRQCGKPVRPHFAFCPNCGANRGPSCPNCRAAVEPGWSHCPSCGAELAGRQPVAG